MFHEFAANGNAFGAVNSLRPGEMETGVNLLLKDDIAVLSSNPFGADLGKLEGACGIAVVEDCSKDVGAALPAFLLPSLPFSLSFVFDSSPPPLCFYQGRTPPQNRKENGEGTTKEPRAR